jgi:hypothetical protein
LSFLDKYLNISIPPVLMDAALLTQDVGTQIYSNPVYGASVTLVRLVRQDASRLEIDVVAALDTQDEKREFSKVLREIASQYDSTIIFHQYHPARYE